MVSAFTDDGVHLSGAGAAEIVPWWSVTKTVLAACALRLVADGVFALDAPVAGAPYSLRQLLSHRAGLRCYGGLTDYHDAVENGATPWPTDEMLARVDAARPAFEPNTVWAYSNIGYMLVGRLIEQTTGEPFATVVERSVFDPLDIRSARFAMDPSDLDATVWGNPNSYHPGWVYHGLLIGSVGDAALFVHRLLTGTFLPADLLNAMTTAHPLGGPIDGRPWQTTGYGLGLMIGDIDGCGLAQGHSAAGPGSVGAVYQFRVLTPVRTVAAFAPLKDEGVVEYRAARLAAT